MWYFYVKIQQCKYKELQLLLQQKYDINKKLSHFGYLQNKEDKINALATSNISVLVFNLQQVLDIPALSTKVWLYKRLLSTFYLTIRDYNEDEGTECYMVHEAIGGRGSNDIASCLHQKIDTYT